MSSKTHIVKLQKKQAKLANKDWARFKASNHGQGAHQDKSKYSRKAKHRTDLCEAQVGDDQIDDGRERLPSMEEAGNVGQSIIG